MKFSEEVLAVIVLYNKRLQDAAAFVTLGASLTAAAQIADILVYDNSPEYSAGQASDTAPGWRITYYADQNNSGVSAAYNKAAEIAGKANKKFVMLLDQDTHFPVETIVAYEEAMAAYPDENVFVPVMLTAQDRIISPCDFRLGRGFYAKRADPGINSLKGRSLINCGICIRVAAFNAAGGYDNRIKLDFSDHEFVRRYSRKVSDSFVVIGRVVHHNLSTSEKQSFKSDKVRFRYYLEGGKYFSESIAGRFLVGTHAILRGLKLSIAHKKAHFVLSALTFFFSSK